MSQNCILKAIYHYNKVYLKWLNPAIFGDFKNVF